MTKYHALMKKDVPANMAKFVQQSAMALTGQGIKILRQNEGPLASVAFESNLTIHQVRELLKDTASLVTQITPMSIPKPVPESNKDKLMRFLGKRYEITTATSLPAMGFDKIWADSEWTDGEGMTFCIIDTGIEEDYYVWNQWNPVADNWFRDRVIETFSARPWTTRCHPHGRICAAVIAKAIHTYEGQMWRGALTKVKFYVARALDAEGNGDSDTVLVCMEWARTKKPHGVTMSLGGQDDPILDEAVERLWELGIPVTIAAGNSGRWPPDCDGSLNCPADAPNAIACGATNAGHVPSGEQEMCQQWSSRAQRPDGTKADWFFVGAGCDIQVELGEAKATGTSLTTPHIQAGALSVLFMLMKRHPDWTPQQVAIKLREIFKATALNLGYAGSPNHTPEGAYCLQGHGRCQFDKAWAMAKETGNGPQPPSEISQVEFYLNSIKVGTATQGTNDVFQFSQKLSEGSYKWKSKSYSEGLDPVETEEIPFTVVKPTTLKKIVAKPLSPTKDQTFNEGEDVPFKVEAKVVEAS